MPFSDRSQTVALVALLAQPDPAIEVHVENLITESAAIDAYLVTQYRPYYVVAKLLEQTPAHQQLGSADGVSFTGMVRPIQSYLDIQLALDLKYGWIVPPGFAAIDPNAKEATPQSTVSLSNIAAF